MIFNLFPVRPFSIIIQKKQHPNAGVRITA
jgi:hypothetical protein